MYCIVIGIYAIFIHAASNPYSSMVSLTAQFFKWFDNQCLRFGQPFEATNQGSIMSGLSINLNEHCMKFKLNLAQLQLE